MVFYFITKNWSFKIMKIEMNIFALKFRKQRIESYINQSE